MSNIAPVKVISVKVGLGLIKSGNAKAESLVFCPDRQKTYVAISRFDKQSTEHYPIGAGDLRDTSAGSLAAAAAGLAL